jgi:hypothetical protein
MTTFQPMKYYAAGKNDAALESHGQSMKESEIDSHRT